MPISPKMKNRHKFNYLNLLMVNETILEMPYCQFNFGKNKLEVITFWGNLGGDTYLGPLARNRKECHKLRYYGLFWVLNTLLAFSYQGGENVTVLTIWAPMLFTVFIISLDLQNMYIFFKTFLARTFYYAVRNIFNIRD